MLSASLSALLFLLFSSQYASSLSNLGFCFGEDSICSVGNELYADCAAYDLTSGDLDPWYECICGNGYVAVREACYWCQLVYQLDSFYSGDSLTQGCSSASATIAPIPTSVLSRESAFNATYTGPPPPGQSSMTRTATLTDSSAASSTGSETVTLTGDVTSTSLTASSSASSSKSSTSSATPGETLAVTTYNGGSAPSPTSSLATASNTAVASTPAASTGGAGGGYQSRQSHGGVFALVLGLVALI